ncbi:MAG: argininosuccinate lyase [Enterobacterales bacterium]|nr:argininosuccinate lyase [Enterobacterales bacterium]
MTQPLWQKSTTSINESMMQYMAGEDVILDRELILYDIQASIAHVMGLASISLLTQPESQQLIEQLKALAKAIKTGDFVLDNRFEDCHSAIEYWLIDKLGELGKKVHTGRSRNDQILVATRLYLKDALQQVIALTRNSAESCLQKAKQGEAIAMPGYTHLQQAVPSSVGMWFAGFAESMIDNLISLKAALQLVDANPLGTAAGYGVNLPLDRELTRQKLDFERLQINPIYAQNSRGKFEIATLNAMSLAMLDIRRYCWDISIFTTQEFAMVKLPAEMMTGSSIMPNKNNPDLVELMRASYSVVQSSIVELQSLLSLPSGYQRDLQLSKPAMLRGIKKVLDTFALFPALIEGTDFIAEACAAKMSAPMYATDLAIELSAQGVPFRTAYQQVANSYDELEQRKPDDSLKARVSPGGCANLMLHELEQRLMDLS